LNPGKPIFKNNFAPWCLVSPGFDQEAIQSDKRTLAGFMLGGSILSSAKERQRIMEITKYSDRVQVVSANDPAGRIIQPAIAMARPSRGPFANNLLVISDCHDNIS
jgi:hypothetical protein